MTISAAEAAARYFSKNRQRLLEEQRARRRTPEGKRKRKDADLRMRYGITHDDYTAQFIKQDGLCAICHQPPSGRGFHVDHDHETGKLRGLLCHSCNTGLGHFRENEHLMARAADYLKEPTWT